MNPGAANRTGFRVQKATAIYHDYGGFLYRATEKDIRHLKTSEKRRYYINRQTPHSVCISFASSLPIYQDKTHLLLYRFE